VGDIGLHGEGRRKHGRLIPHYRMHFGGDGRADGIIAVRGPEVPAMRAPQAVKRVKRAFAESRNDNERFIHWAQRQGSGYFAELLQDLQEINATDMEFLAKDFGETQDFQVLALGGGECMGAAQETVSANFSEAAHEREYRRVFLLARKTEQALDCVEAIARLVGHSLLSVSGERNLPETLPEIASALAQTHQERAHLAESLRVFTSELARLQAQFDEGAFQRLADTQDVWTVLVAEACQEIDLQLDLQSLLPEVTQLAKAV
jgi:isopenicillin N synthase-like dioxygenase